MFSAVDDSDGYFGALVAAGYDDPADRMNQPEAIEPAVSFLAALAGDGRALELAIGTGRIGLPLSRAGVAVHGIELSRAMVRMLRAKPGGDAVDVTIGDMTTTKVACSFALAYLVFNTINNLTTQDAQVACFRNVAGHLAPDGCFVIETAIPPLRALPAGQDILGYRAGPDGSCPTATTSRPSGTTATTSSSAADRASTGRFRSAMSGLPNST